MASAKELIQAVQLELKNHQLSVEDIIYIGLENGWQHWSWSELNEMQHNMRIRLQVDINDVIIIFNSGRVISRSNIKGQDVWQHQEKALEEVIAVNPELNIFSVKPIHSRIKADQLKSAACL